MMGLDKLRLLTPRRPCQEFFDLLNAEFKNPTATRVRFNFSVSFHLHKPDDPLALDRIHPFTVARVWTKPGVVPQFMLDLNWIAPGGKQPPSTVLECNPNKFPDGWNGVRNLVDDVFSDDCPDLKVTRVDLNAEVEGVSIDYLFNAIRIPRKRKGGDVGEMWRNKGPQTFKIGKKPAFIRVYDKIEELKYQGEDLAGFPEVLSRLEWELHGDRICTVTGLGKKTVIQGKDVPPSLFFSELPNLQDVRPFRKLQFLEAIEYYDWRNDNKNSHFRFHFKKLCEAYGANDAVRIINSDNRNFTRDYKPRLIDNDDLKDRIEQSYADTTRRFFDGKGADVRFLYNNAH